MKISICIPTYNRAELLRECLTHIIPQVQSASDIEIIVCDNASLDHTKQVVEEYQKGSPNVKYFCNHENLGFDGNVLACITRATGEYVFFLSDDDIVLRGTIQLVDNYIENCHPSIISIGHYAFSGNDYHVRTRVFFPSFDKQFENGEEFFFFTGVGFISGLVLKRKCALQFVDSVRIGKGCAHLEIASRVALTCEGPYLYIGTVQIAARSPEKDDYDLMVNGYINVLEVYRILVEEGILSRRILDFRAKSMLSDGLPKYILNQIVLGDVKKINSQRKVIEETFKDYRQYYMYCHPLFFLPRPVIFYPYRFLHKLVLKWRIIKHNRKVNMAIANPTTVKILLKKIFPLWLLKLRQDYQSKKYLREYNILSTQQVFTKIYEDGAWGKSIDPKQIYYSGDGSHDHSIVSTYVEAIEHFFSIFEIKPSAVDLGCGDFSVGSKVRHLFDKYIACDIVDPVISFNKGKYKNINVDFRVLDITKDDLPDGDVVFIRQVLQHLSNEQISAAISKISSKYKYFVLTEHLPSSDTFIHNLDKPSGPDIRFDFNSGIVLTSAPFNLKIIEDTCLCEIPHELGGRVRTNLYRLS
jgi:glycosyltransferase involved in cell wall biosynthesis